MFLAQKPWVDGSLVGKLKASDAAYKQGKAAGDNRLVKQYKYDLRRSIKMAKHNYRDKVQEQGICGREKYLFSHDSSTMTMSCQGEPPTTTWATHTPPRTYVSHSNVLTLTQLPA